MSQRLLTASLLIAGLLVSACGLLPKAPGIGAVVPPNPVLTCDDVKLGRPSGRPTNTIELGAVPSDYGEFPALKVTDPDSGNAVVVPVNGDSGRRGADFVVPVHPNGKPEGGAVTLEMFDGDGASCDALNFTIEPLPDSPGAFREVVELLGRAHEQAVQWFPATPPGPELGPDLPLEIARDRLNGPDNPNSLEKIVDGSADLSGELTPEDERLMDGLVDESGFLEALEEWIQELTDEGWGPQVQDHIDPPKSPPPSPPSPPGAPKDAFCDGSFYAPSAAALSRLMRAQGVGGGVQSTVGPVMDAASTLATVVAIGSLPFTAGVPNPVTLGATVLGTGISVVDLLTEASEKLLPGEFVSLTFDYEQPLYMEDDEPLTGSWDNVMVTARSEGMSLDGIILNAVLKKAGGRLTRRFLGKHIGNQVVEKAAEFQGELVGGGVAKQAEKKFGKPGGFIPLPSCEYGPTDITDEKYHYAEFDPADGPGRVVRYRDFQVVDTGEADLLIHAKPDMFGGRTVTGIGPVFVKPIEITIEPDRANGDPGYTATFHVKVENARNPDVSFTLRPEGGHKLTQRFIEPDAYEVTIVTSPDSRDFPATLLVQSTSTTGLRAKPGAPPRQATALLTSGGGVSVSPWSTCVPRGKSEQFTATVTGYDNQEVTWRTSGGSISASGLFTAPEQDGQIVVEAVSDADANAIGRAVVRVAEHCMCFGAISLPQQGVTATTTKLGLSLGSSMLNRENELQELTMDFAEETNFLNVNPLSIMFFLPHTNVLTESPPASEFSVPASGGTHKARDGVYYHIMRRNDGTVDYYYVPNEAHAGELIMPKTFRPNRRTYTGPQLGQTGTFYADADNAGFNEQMSLTGRVMGYGIGNNRYAVDKPTAKTMVTALRITRPLWAGPDSGYVYDEHEFELRDVEVTPEWYDDWLGGLPIIVEEFVAEGDDEVSLRASVDDFIAVYDSNVKTYTVSPVRMTFEGRFASPSTMFGGSTDLFARLRNCAAPGGN